MELKQLRTFLAVANAHSFLAAADNLYISRQAVSKTVDNLEDELGVALFLRNQSGAELTTAGNYFFPRAESLIADADRLKKEMQNIESTFRPTVRICMSLGIYSLYAEKLRKYRDIHRDEMKIELSGCLDYDCDTVLPDRRADAVLSFLPQKNKIACSELLRESPLVALINRGNPLSDYDEGTSVRINNAPLLIYNGGRRRGLWGSGKLKETDVISCDLQYLYSLLKEDRGILILPEFMVPTDIDYAECLPLDFTSSTGQIHFSRLLPSYYNETLNHLLDQIREDVFLS